MSEEKTIEITFEVKPLRKTMTMPDLDVDFELEVAICKQFYKQGIEDLINDVGDYGFNPCATIRIVRSDGAKDSHSYAGDFTLEEIEEPDLFCEQPNRSTLETPPEWTEDNYEHELLKEAGIND